MICDQAQGSHSEYRGPVEAVSGLAEGIYKANICIENVYDREDPDRVEHYHVIVTMMSVAEVRWKNRVEDFTNE